MTPSDAFEEFELPTDDGTAHTSWLVAPMSDLGDGLILFLFDVNGDCICAMLDAGVPGLKRTRMRSGAYLGMVASAASMCAWVILGLAGAAPASAGSHSTVSTTVVNVRMDFFIIVYHDSPPWS